MTKYRRRLVIEFTDQNEADRIQRRLKTLVAAEGTSIRKKVLMLIERELAEKLKG